MSVYLAAVLLSAVQTPMKSLGSAFHAIIMGDVKVNGVVVTDPDARVETGDTISYKDNAAFSFESVVNWIGNQSNEETAEC